MKRSLLEVVSNTSGQAQKVTVWVGETAADMVSDVDTIQTLDISAVTEYDICFLDGPLTNILFNDTSIEVGQRIFIEGRFASSVFAPTMISLRRQGLYGTFVPGSVTIATGNAGFFSLTNNGLVGYAVGGPVTVNTFNGTIFFNLSGLSQLETTTTAIPARELLLKSTTSGTTEFYAGFVADPPQTAAQ